MSRFLEDYKKIKRVKYVQKAKEDIDFILFDYSFGQMTDNDFIRLKKYYSDSELYNYIHEKIDDYIIVWFDDDYIDLLKRLACAQVSPTAFARGTVHAVKENKNDKK